MDENDPLVERSRLRVGSLLKDKWRLDELIGVGGMAAVYSATHRNGHRVAVKMLHAELSVDGGEIKRRFLKEGYAANAVEHPGAVKVLDDETDDDGSVFLVMELLDGESLTHRFERKARSLVIEEVLIVADQILDVLAAAHEKGIVHRDVKPDNIFLTRSGGVKLLDFGIARLREVSTTSSATRSGSTIGTPAYMAPEQARARWEEVDGRTDLWAVGATMFKLLTGRIVHLAETVNEQLLAAMTEPAPAISALAPTVPIPVVEIVDRALAFNKQDRWPDARHMQQAVRDAYRALAGEAPASVRLSFDEEGRANAQPVDASGKVPTSLTAAHDSASLSSRRPRRRSIVGWMLTLGALGATGYFFVSKGKVDLPSSLSFAADGGSTGVNLVIPSALEAIERALPSSPAASDSAPPSVEAPPSVVETPAEPIDSVEPVPAPVPSSTPIAAPGPAPAAPARVSPPTPPKPAPIHKQAPSKKHTHPRRRP